MNVNRLILKVRFKGDKSVEITFVFIDELLLTKENERMIYFHNSNFNFMIYSRKTFKRSVNSLRLPSYKNYTSDSVETFDFKTELEMYEWLKRLHSTINECNNNFTPFVKDPNHKDRLERVILSDEWWLL